MHPLSKCVPTNLDKNVEFFVELTRRCPLVMHLRTLEVGLLKAESIQVFEGSYEMRRSWLVTLTSW
jgi:hypothetical protein